MEVMGSSMFMELAAAQWEDLQTTPACSIIVRPSCIHCFTCCCCPSTMRCTGPLKSPRSKRVRSEAWRMSDRNEVKMGLGIARAPKGADATRTMEAAKRIAAQGGMGWDGSKLDVHQPPKIKPLFSARHLLIIYKATSVLRKVSSRTECIPSYAQYCTRSLARSLFVASLNELIFMMT